MIVLSVELEKGFKKADIHSIPTIRDETIFAYARGSDNANAEQRSSQKSSSDGDLRVDFVQVRKTAELCEARAIVFPAATGCNSESHVRVGLKVDTKKSQILESICEQCPKKECCPHILSFIFWLHRKSNDKETPAVRDFWGSEWEAVVEQERTEPLRIRDMLACDELRIEGDVEAAAVNETDGRAFLEAVLDEMAGMGLRNSALYRHCRRVSNEFEAIFVHHTLLDAANNAVKDMRSFAQYMEDQAKLGMFERIAEVSRNCYKTPLWLETQYMRLRCSLIHRIASRKDTYDDENILEALLCKDREYRAEERQQLKQHKRFILKQTEKLENKTYNECGLLLNESYPYICATPDGITDDHIVEIKAPKTEEEFEKYLEGRETIAAKYMAQIQIQMYMANVTKALYCVLSPTFDTNGALHYVWVQADMEFVASLLGAAEDFWKEIVFPRLVKIYSIN